MSIDVNLLIDETRLIEGKKNIFEMRIDLRQLNDSLISDITLTWARVDNESPIDVPIIAVSFTVFVGGVSSVKRRN